MIKRVGYFVIACVTLWVVVAIPARRWWGDEAAIYAAVALLICLIPTTLTLLWSGWARSHSPEQQMVAVLGGTIVRLFFVFLCGLALYQFVPYFQHQSSFLVWLLMFYLSTLAIEVSLLVAYGDHDSTSAQG